MKKTAKELFADAGFICVSTFEFEGNKQVVYERCFNVGPNVENQMIIFNFNDNHFSFSSYDKYEEADSFTIENEDAELIFKAIRQQLAEGDKNVESPTKTADL